MDETQLRLDGNAAAGIFRELFVHEMTVARGACASCGSIAQMGAQELYMFPLSPGAVLRCNRCHGVDGNSTDPHTPAIAPGRPAMAMGEVPRLAIRAP